MSHKDFQKLVLDSLSRIETRIDARDNKVDIWGNRLNIL